MELRIGQSAQSLGEVLLDARTRRGLTQEELGKDSGIGQAAVAKIERNRSVPKVTTLCRYLRALSLTPEEEFDVWHQIRGKVKEINWAERLGLTSFEQARSKAKGHLNGGAAYDAYGYIESMTQFASTADERALAEMLHANRFKELGLYSLAEQYYNRATVTLGSSGENMTMSSVLVNLADLHAEQGRYTLADAYIVYALQRDLAQSSRAFACLVKGRVKMSQGGEDGRVEAEEWFTKAFNLYGEMETQDTGEAGQAWAHFYLARLKALSSTLKDREEGMVTLKALAQRFGPSDNPSNPELFARVSLTFAELQGDVMNLSTAQRIAKKHALRGVMARVKALKIAIGAAGLFFALIMGSLPTQAQAMPPREGDLPALGESIRSPGIAAERTRRSAFVPVRDRDHGENSGMYDWIQTLWADLVLEGVLYKDIGLEDDFSDNGPEK